MSTSSKSSPRSGTSSGPPLLENLATVTKLLKDGESRWRSLLPAGSNVDRYMRGVLETVVKSPALLGCTQSSFRSSVSQAAKLGLAIDDILGEAYLVPYKTQCSLIAGYKGYLKLVRQSPDVLRVMAHPVYEVDQFDFEYGCDANIRHKPKARTREELAVEALAFVYCLVSLKNGLNHPFVMPAEQVWEHRNKFAKEYRYKESSGKKDSIWHKHPIAMAVKTVVRAACSSGQVPIDVDVQRIAVLDATIEREGSDELRSSDAAKADADALSERLAAQATKPASTNAESVQNVDKSTIEPEELEDEAFDQFDGEDQEQWSLN